jgi:3-hydroxyacyl-[acyl-carrier-protein] dehydratase
MLRDQFYSTIAQSSTDDQIDARIAFNADHEIFRGHFPALPVVPGVCMVQIVREVMEVFVEAPLSLVASDNMKFLAVIDPTKNMDFEVRINFMQQEECYHINASIASGPVIFFKMKAALSTRQWK